jgi:transposase
LEAELAAYQEQLEALAHMHPVCQRLLTIPGIGPLTATALIAAVAMHRCSKMVGNLLPG